MFDKVVTFLVLYLRINLQLNLFSYYNCAGRLIVL